MPRGLCPDPQEGRLTQAELAAVSTGFDERWIDLAVVELDEEVMRTAARGVHDHRLRARDAIHLASAIAVSRGPRRAATFACWDARLWEAAAALGFRMAPRARPA